MNWENIVKKKKLIGGQKKLDKDNDGDIDADDFASMRMEKQADCKVTVCDATTCMHNANKRCTLDEITINSKGKCNYFVVRKDNKMPEPKYVNFTPKTVDRLKRTVRENPTQGLNEELNERRR